MENILAKAQNKARADILIVVDFPRPKLDSAAHGSPPYFVPVGIRRRAV